MKNNIWKSLKKPIFILAPMEDVTDTVFRKLVISQGRPDLFFTEFTNCEALLSKGKVRVEHRLQFTPEEKPIIAQIWGNKPEQFKKVAEMLVEMGFDGIDINMGCPEKSVIKQGACSALIKNKKLAHEIILATKKGVKNKIPISVKTRIGFNEIQTDEWIGFLLDQKIDALTIHLRTVKEMSNVPAHWDEIEKAVNLRNMKNINTIIIGNGDIVSKSDALEKIKKYKIDGVMIGRGIFHNPWLFNEKIKYESKSINDKLNLLKKHVILFNKTWDNKKNYHILKKYYKIYIQGFDNANKIRVDLMETKNAEEAITKVEKLLTLFK